MKIKSGFVLEEVGGSFLAVAVGDRADSFSGMVRMNGTGAFLWRILAERDVTEDELVDELSSAYEVEKEVARGGVSDFLSKLVAGGILE